MCGILGSIGPRAWEDDVAAELAALIAHRGPDGQGIHVEPGLCLAHRRLAILDPTERGNQPMRSRSGNTILVLNGEIYNFHALRRELQAEGASFETETDTEVLVEGLERHGVEYLRRLRGMFAFAAHDRRTGTLLLARDPLGKKPLYHATHRGTLHFASELRVLRRALRPGVDTSALPFYFHLGYVPSPRTIYDGVESLEPGEWMSWRDGVVRRGRHWKLPEVGPSAEASEDALLEQLDAHLRTAVSRRLVSDVPLGAFLSGGVDSTLIASYLAELAPGTVAVTVGVDDPELDESEDAARTARGLDLRHVVRHLTVPDANTMIDDLTRCLDQPFADSSMVPTLVLSRQTRHEVVVALGGDGGDEAFGGYDRYSWLLRTLSTRKKYGGVASRLLAPAGRFHDRIRRWRPALDAPTDAASYFELMKQWHFGSIESLCGSTDELREWTEALWPSQITDPVHAARRVDLHSYLPDDILVKVDRASMWSSLEVRAPFLDVDLIEWAFAASVASPLHFRGKRLLRQLLARRVPDYDFDLPKKGFRLPVVSWLEGPLAPRLREICDPAYVTRQGWFDPQEVQAAWKEFRAGRKSMYSPLWAYFVFQNWWEANYSSP